MRVERILGVAVLACGLAVAGAARADNGVCSSPTAIKVSSDCGSVTWTGCCAGGDMIWCEEDGSALCQDRCAADEACGWIGTIDDPFWGPIEVNAYYCGGDGEDPSGDFPLSCGVTCTASCTGKDCGTDGCFGFCGDCSGDTPECLQTSGQCVDCAPKCWMRACGEDGCGGTCGTCPAGDTCIVTDEEYNTTECCTPDCAGKVCGPDGCGGTCGAGCTDTQYCSDDQSACVDCTCTGKTCGGDGCGNACGTCPAGKGCDDAGQCITAPSHCIENPAGGCGGCGCEECVCAADEVCCQSAGADGDGWDFICIYECQADCGGDLCPCIPDCTDRQCGSDGCDGTCGTCTGAGQVCTDEGTCCVPSCTGKDCGDDGCGGSCGTCEDPLVCEANQCVACTPQCEGKECGEDGCGATCGTCPEGKVCAGEGECIGATYPDSCLGLDTPSADSCDSSLTLFGCCDNRGRVIWCDGGKLFCIDCPSNGEPASQTCGWADNADFTGYDCGNVGEDPAGTNPLECGFCLGSCVGRDCGDDGCGGTCGTCDSGDSCVAGACVPPAGDVIEPDAVDSDVPSSDAVGTDTTGTDTTVTPDNPPPLDTGVDRGTGDNTVSDTSRDNAATDTVPGTDTTPTKKSGGGCTAGAGAPALPWALLLGLPGVVAFARRRRD